MTSDDLEFSTEEKAAALRETLESAGWRKVILPALEKMLANKRARLENGFAMDIERMREVQAEIRLLKQFTERSGGEFLEAGK